MTRSLEASLLLGFSEPVRALVIGARGGVGEAFVESLLRTPDAQVWATSRSPQTSTHPRRTSSFLDITDEDSPLEAGLGFVIKFDKPGGFIGREALLQQQEQGLSRHLVQLQLANPEPLIYHNEPIWRSGELVGHITSGAYGHTLSGSVGLGYVRAQPGEAAEAVLSGDYEVEIACERFPARASLRPLYDPDNHRIRC